MGAAMGKGIREFKKSLRDVQSSIDSGGSDDLPSGGAGRQIDQAGRSGDPKKLSQ
jgi:Sec-independent protein translocase protein TatA